MDQLRTQSRMKQTSVTSCQESSVVKRYQQHAIDRFKLHVCHGSVTEVMTQAKEIQPMAERALCEAGNACSHVLY